MNDLPIVKMTLYKHGVAFYQRRGQISGEAAGLEFPKEAMNDVLKSLTAYTVGGGQVAGMDYDTPDDKEALLARASIHLSDSASLRDLLRDLRGCRVEITALGQRTAGLVVGVDLPDEREAIAATLVSVFLPEERAVRPVRLGDIEGLALADERAAKDLAYVLETSLAAEDKRKVTVRLAPGGADLVVSYIAPSPTWRVSYRLVANTEDGQTGALLQGWGLFDNTFDEDLQGVDLTLIAGMPVSFIYDLYTPFTPDRPVVREEARTVAAPAEFLAAAAEMPAEPGPAGMRRGLRAAGMGPAAAKMAPQALADATAVAAVGQAQGEFFSYQVTAPVSVGRGRSAMVPILGTELALRKQRIYNGAKHPANPFVTLAVKNETGLTLERGPLTVIEDGEYAGEAMLPFTGPGGDIYLAYAVDLAVTVTEQTEVERVLRSVKIEKGLLALQEYEIRRTAYRVENRHTSAVEVMVEHPRMASYTPFETPDPAETTVDVYRYAIAVPAHQAGALTVKVRRLLARREEIYSQQLERLRQWLQDKILDEATYATLQKILAIRERIDGNEAQLKQNQAARAEIRERQRVARENLAALGTRGEEGELRARYVKNLGQAEDELKALDDRDAGLRADSEAAQAEIEAILAALP